MIVNNEPLIEVIADKHSDEDQLVRAIEKLGGKKEAPKFWTDIAANEGYSRFHRRHSVFQLFYRHVTPGMTLSHLVPILQSPEWLANRNIAAVADLGGYIPVRLSFDNTVLTLDIIPDLSLSSDHWYVYIGVVGLIDPKDFCRLIHGGTVDQPTSDATILEIGFSPPVVDSLKTGQ